MMWEYLQRQDPIVYSLLETHFKYKRHQLSRRKAIKKMKQRDMISKNDGITKLMF